jgi:hypothetical protein
VRTGDFTEEAEKYFERKKLNQTAKKAGHSEAAE